MKRYIRCSYRADINPAYGRGAGVVDPDMEDRIEQAVIEFEEQGGYPDVRSMLRKTSDTDILRYIIERDSDNSIYWVDVILNPNCPKDVANRMAESDDYTVRRDLAEYTKYRDVLKKLLNDDNYIVRAYALRNDLLPLEDAFNLLENDTKLQDAVKESLYGMGRYALGKRTAELANKADELRKANKSRAKHSDSSLLKLLRQNGIDTTRSNYELKAETYERYSRGDVYVKKFSCPGDWLAYFSMLIHKVPNQAALNEFGIDLQELKQYIDDYPTITDIKNHASKNWWGDGDDYIIYLKNTAAGNYLYGPVEEEPYDNEEDW